VRNTPPLRALWRELISYNDARPDLPDQVAWMHRVAYDGRVQGVAARVWGDAVWVRGAAALDGDNYSPTLALTRPNPNPAQRTTAGHPAEGQAAPVAAARAL